MSDEKQLWKNILLPFGLFVLLSPGTLGNFPWNSSKQCSDLIPLPKKYTFEKGDHEGTSESQSISADALTGPAMKPILQARKRCLSTRHFYSSFTQVLFHALLFTFLYTIGRHLIN
jgi:hypothetical protein